MASTPKFFDRVQESSTTTGTGTYTLAGAITGFQTFAAVGDGNSCYYCAQEVDGNGNPSGGWEVGLGTYTASGTTLSRDTILASTNSNNAVSWAAGTRRIFLTVPAAGAVGDMVSNLFAAEVSVTTGITLTSTAFGKMHVCSGTSADYTVGLPASSGNAGKVIGFRMATGLTKLVTLDANSTETIDAALTRVLWAGETAVLLCDGSNWFKITGKSIPMIARMYLLASQTGVVNNTTTKVNIDTVDIDNTGMMADTTNKRINIKRAATYDIAGVVQWDNISESQVDVETLTRINGSTEIADAGTVVSLASSYPAVYVEAPASLAVSDYVELLGYHLANGGSANQTFRGINKRTSLAVIERVTW